MMTIRNLLNPRATLLSMKGIAQFSRNFSRFNKHLGKIQSIQRFPNQISIYHRSLNQCIIFDQIRSISFAYQNRIPDKLASLQIKKRPVRKKRIEVDGNFSVVAYATAEEYDLDKLKASLIKQNLYQLNRLLPADVTENEDVLYATAIYQVSEEPREIFFFREGSVVFWNCSELEFTNVLSFLQQYEVDGYSRDLVEQESENMFYKYDETKSFLRNDGFFFKRHEGMTLEKYAFSNAMSTSVKLGIWEAALDAYVDSMEFVTEDLKRGRKIRMSRSEVLRKTGELFALRHLINLSSDLLDTPDFYWDREQLENLYNTTCAYFAIHRRTKVMNEKLNHCVELAELVSSNLNDKHHVRLEWMIIVLIMIEVAFETLHYVDRYVAAQNAAQQMAVVVDRSKIQDDNS